MSKIIVSVPKPVLDSIRVGWNDLIGSVNIPISNRKLVLWALERFAQLDDQTIKQLDTTIVVPISTEDVTDEKIVDVVVDVPDQLFNRIDEMWKSFVGVTYIDLTKKNLMRWALDRFVRFCNTANTAR